MDSEDLKLFPLEMGNHLLEGGHASLSITPDEVLQAL
jgi:hypothetical protein